MVFGKKQNKKTNDDKTKRNKKEKKRREIAIYMVRGGEGNYHKIWHGKSVHESTVGEM